MMRQMGVNIKKYEMSKLYELNPGLKNIVCLNNYGFVGKTYEFQNVFVKYTEDGALMFKDFEIVITQLQDIVALEVYLTLFTQQS